MGTIFFSKIPIKRKPNVNQYFSEVAIKMKAHLIKSTFQWIMNQNKYLLSRSWTTFVQMINLKMPSARWLPSWFVLHIWIRIWPIKIQHFLFKKTDLKMLSAKRRQNTVSVAFQCRRDQHWSFTGPPGASSYKHQSQKIVGVLYINRGIVILSNTFQNAWSGVNALIVLWVWTMNMMKAILHTIMETAFNQG